MPAHPCLFKKRGFLGVLAIILAFALLPCDPAFGADKAAGTAAKKPLIVYFSQSGHTRKIAHDIQKKIGGDLVEIEVVNPYPADYDTLTKVAKKELEQKFRPDIKTKIPNIGEYGVVFLGFPNWWSSMPMPVYAFIEQNGLDGKTIAPFMTHGGGGLGHAIDDLKKEAPHSKILKPLSVPGNSVDRAEKDVIKWIEGLGPALIETTTGNPQIYPDGAY